MELSFEAEVSTRHLSFLETGRSNPSRRMIQRLGAALDLPLRQQNHLLVAAGYAPVYGQADIADRSMREIRDGLRFLLDNHDPYPAFVLNRMWNIVMSNRTHLRMLERLQAVGGSRREEPENALRLVLAPDRLRPLISNWPQVVRAVIPRLERQIRLAAHDRELEELREEVLGYPMVLDALRSSSAAADGVALLVPIELEFDRQRLSFYTTIASFGGAVDATTQELVIESLLPANEATRQSLVRFAEAGAQRVGTA